MKNYMEDLIQNSPRGVISYADYIGAALYHPELGYYMRDNVKIGTHGDFITSSNFSDVYGNILAKWYANNYRTLGLSAAVCEMGGGNGRFAKAFLDGWKKHSQEKLTYFLIEASPFHLQLQKEQLTGYEEIRFAGSPTELQDFKGLFFSNELFDALPVHVVEKQSGTVMEVMVGMDNGMLTERFVPLENSELEKFLDREGYNLAEGQRLEVPLEMNKVLESISCLVTKGLVLTVDYGYRKTEWMEPARFRGSLRGYRQQRMVHDILQDPGKMDITSHVHFDALINSGEELDLHFVTMKPQDKFLIEIGILDELAENYNPDPFSGISRRNRAVRSLIMPGGISSAFHVIVQEKGLEIPVGFLDSKKAMG
ncbi:class I SAM-dependent methyltransferase [Mesobacillus zeae]|uniref:SAM-dependent methyltransferase n=1 Tax=Mesobacillus zeae TaxID=1917180 RepID=A0A398B299_9BACI|nr:SAM-dependent methyltransferase [Mesobacillus zeae]RID83977.1 SAM-dependent methyltransferase [Mesobacillus zeae]